MYRKSVQPIVYQVLVDSILAALATRPAAALAATPNVHLFVNNFTPTPHNILTDFTEATFTGGATQVLGTPAGPVSLDNITRGLISNNVFTCTAAPSPSQTVYGYYLTDTGNAILWIAEKFADPVPIVGPGDFLSLDYIFAEPLIRQTAQTEL